MSDWPASSVRNTETDETGMPPRKKPPSGSRFRAATGHDPAVHLDGFLLYLRNECGMAENTIRAYRQDLTQFLDWNRTSGLASVHEIDLPFLTGYLDHLQQRKLAASSIARHLVSIKMLFRFLVLEGILVESAVDLVNSPRLWQRLPKVLSPEKVDELLTAPGPEDRYALRDRAILAVLYATGCRASEVAQLTLRDIAFTDGFCRCLGKGNKERIVSLNPTARNALDLYLDRERPRLVGSRDTQTVFVSRSGQAINRVTVWALVKRYAARIGCSRDVSPHSLRHSFATHMLAGGADIRTLQEMLGHASIATTQIYTHVEHSRLKSIHQDCHPRG